jgi:UrcA family protein
MRMTAPIVPIALALAVAAATTPASADPPTITVRTADFDLATGAGVAALDRRIGRAIELICGAAAPADLDAQAAVEDCRAASWKEVSGARSTLLAAARAGSPRLAMTNR